MVRSVVPQKELLIGECENVDRERKVTREEEGKETDESGREMKDVSGNSCRLVGE